MKMPYAGLAALTLGAVALALGTAAAAQVPGSAPPSASTPDTAAPAAAAPGTPSAAAPAASPAAAPAASAAPATPTVGVYNIELVVCRFTTALGSAEDWASEAPQAAPAAGDTQAAGGRFVKLLGPGELQLNDVESRLRANGTCLPVAHFGWAQTASPWGSQETLDLAQLGAATGGVTGTAQLLRGEFLHLALSLNLQVDAPPAGLGAAPGTVFTLRDNHRVRFYERDYFDTPAFGVIALVTPAQGRRPGR
ncbi:MAG TPA: CsiV family protein [Steroidobacteraceae bacterium]|nr:CsiV family protein [Steroidobacteraceae bacterium]